MTTTITWIPVAESLPDADITVLLHDSEDDISLGYFDGEDWRYAHGSTAGDVVLHWADLPAAPCLPLPPKKP